MSYHYYYVGHSHPYRIQEMHPVSPRSSENGFHVDRIMAEYESYFKRIEFYENKLNSEDAKGRKKYRAKIKTLRKAIHKMRTDHAEYFI